MRQRGRKPIDATKVSVIEGGFDRRPEPPEALTERQQAIWRETVSAEPVDWFGTAALRAMLSSYCRHVEAEEMFSTFIALFRVEHMGNADGFARLNAAMKARERESRAAAALAGKLRLTNQSRYTPKSAGTATRNTAKGPRPWEMT